MGERGVEVSEDNCISSSTERKKSQKVIEKALQCSAISGCGLQNPCSKVMVVEIVKTLHCFIYFSFEVGYSRSFGLIVINQKNFLFMYCVSSSSLCIATKHGFHQ